MQLVALYNGATCCMSEDNNLSPQKAIFYTGTLQDNYVGHIMKELFFDKVYAPFIEGKKDLVILDIGAHIGLFSIYASPFAKQIYTVEPSMEHFTSLTQNIQSNYLTNVTPFNFAISNKEGEASFYRNPNKTMYSLKKEVSTDPSQVETVKTTTLEILLDENKIEHVDFMKLDIEGEEYEVLGGGAFRRIASRVKSLVVESHNWANRHPNQLREALKNNGYSVSQLNSDANLFYATR